MPKLELPSLSFDENAAVGNARDAIKSLKQTYEFWLVIARGLDVLKKKAARLDDAGRQTFDRLREREGLGKKLIGKDRVSRLLAILANQSKVDEWRATLTEKELFAWASPEAIMRRCPEFQTPRQKGKREMTGVEKLRKENEALKERNKELEEEGSGDRFKTTDTAKNIAVVMVSMFSPSKAREIATHMLVLLNAAAKRAKEATAKDAPRPEAN